MSTSQRFCGICGAAAQAVPRCSRGHPYLSGDTICRQCGVAIDGMQYPAPTIRARRVQQKGSSMRDLLLGPASAWLLIAAGLAVGISVFQVWGTGYGFDVGLGVFGVIIESLLAMLSLFLGVRLIYVRASMWVLALMWLLTVAEIVMVVKEKNMIGNTSLGYFSNVGTANLSFGFYLALIGMWATGVASLLTSIKKLESRYVE